MKALRIIIAMVFFVLFLPIILADTELTYPHEKLVNVRRPCFNNGTYCSDNAECNITIIAPDTSLVLDNQNMTNMASYHNVTTIFHQLGVHSVYMSCCDGGVCGEDTFEIDVTGAGNATQIFPIQFSIILFAGLMIFGSFFNEKLRIFRYSGAALLMVIGVITLHPGYSGINWTNLEGLAVGTIAIGAGFVFLVQDAFSRKEEAEHYDRYHEEEEYE